MGKMIIEMERWNEANFTHRRPIWAGIGRIRAGMR
jgi:hypothetical protein